MKWFPVREDFFSRSASYIRAVDGVSFDLREGETLGLVGESGSGKSTLGKLLVRLEKPNRGEIEFEGKDVISLKGRDLALFRKTVQVIFQDPRGSLNPRMSVEKILVEPLVYHGISRGREAKKQAAHLLELVGLPPETMPRFPHEFSGGERQRIGIARALSLNPRFVVADEPVTALDVSVQGQIVNLLLDLQRKLGLTLLFIAHDLCIVYHAASRVIVMYLGKILEIAPADRLIARPAHPYTKILLSSLPRIESEGDHESLVPEGEPGDSTCPPSGCVFHPRCRYETPRCRKEFPAFSEIEKDHHVACVLW